MEWWYAPVSRTWWYATSRHATFAFALDENEKVVKCAPYARKWLLGLTRDEARAVLKKRGYSVSALPGSL